MKKSLRFIGVFVLLSVLVGACGQLLGQTTVSELGNVKKPKVGRLYFAQKDSGLYLFNKSWQKIVVREATVTPPDETEKPKHSPPDNAVVKQKIYAGTVSGQPIFKIVFDDGKARSYLYDAGKWRNVGVNIYDNANYRPVQNVNIGDLKKNIIDDVTGNGGLESSKFFFKFPDVVIIDQIVLPGPNDGDRKNGFVAYKEETLLNRISWEQFGSAKLPTGHYATLGWGIQLWKDEPVANGKLKIFDVGYTAAAHLDLFSRNLSEAKNSYYFNAPIGIIAEGAESLVKSGNWKTEWGDANQLYKIVDGKREFGHPAGYMGISKEGAIELGKHLHYHSGSGWNKDTQSWSVSTSDAWFMCDEELYDVYGTQGGNAGRLISFLGYLNQGFKSVAPNRIINWYGKPATWWLHANRSNEPDGEIEKALFSNSFFNHEGFNSGTMIDVPGGYLKVPYVVGANIYKHNADGSFLLQNGKRVYRDDNYVIKHFGIETPIVAKPSEYFKQFAGEISAETESELFVKGVYGYANRTIFGLSVLNKDEFNDNDISVFKADAKKLTCSVMRPRTEPWTSGGLYEWAREVGDDGVKFMVLFAYLSGIRGTELWDNGGWQNELKPRGENHFFDPDHSSRSKEKNWSHMGAWTAAMQTFAKAMQGTDQNKWRYVRFYYPVKGEQNSEVIAAGIYTGDAIKWMVLNPTLEEGEESVISFSAGNFTKKIVLKGRQVYFFDDKVTNGLSPKDFKLEYKNIYGKDIRANGTLGKISEHYF